jgi:hypothetical protein
MRNRIILNQDSVRVDSHAAIMSAIHSTQNPSVSGVVARGRDSAMAMMKDVRISCSIYRSKYLASSLEVKDLCAGITLTCKDGSIL